MDATTMTDLDPALAGCDSALAEAELLLAMLGASGTADTALAPIRESIANLRREVARLRGLGFQPAQRKPNPLWTELGGGGGPWPPGARPGG